MIETLKISRVFREWKVILSLKGQKRCLRLITAPLESFSWSRLKISKQRGDPIVKYKRLTPIFTLYLHLLSFTSILSPRIEATVRIAPVILLQMATDLEKESNLDVVLFEVIG